MVGKPCTFQSLRMPPSRRPSHQCTHGIFSFSRNSFSVSTVSSALTLMSANGLPLSFSTISRSCGIMARHGGHHVPQMSRTTALPLYELRRVGVPLRLLLVTSGALPPMSRLWRKDRLFSASFANRLAPNLGG